MSEIVQKRGGANKYARLYALGPDRLDRINMMMMQDTTIAEVADVICDEWGFYADEREALEKQLQRYRLEQIDSNLAARARNAERTDTGRRLVQYREEQLDIMKEMRDGIAVQKRRINKFLDREENLPIPLNAVKFEMKLYVDMLKEYARLQLETGLLRRAPKQVSGSFHIDEENGTLEFEAEIKTNAELRRATRDIMEILEGDYEVVDDGDHRGTELPRTE